MDFDEALQEALAAVNSQTAQQQMAANIEAGDAAYGQLKEQAAESRDLERQRLAQRMADMGIGTQQPLTVRNNYMMAGNRDTGDITRQNQSYADMQNAMIDQANANAAAQAAQVSAGMNAAEDAADLEEKMNKFDMYYRMYMAKKMTKNQFKKLTGMDVRGWNSTYYALLKKGKDGMLTSDDVREALKKGLSPNLGEKLYNYVSGMQDDGLYLWMGKEVPYLVFKEYYNANQRRKGLKNFI